MTKRIEELNISFKLAATIGLNESILFTTLAKLIEQNGVYLEDNRWISMTYPDWQAQFFPFWSISTIKRLFTTLEEKKLIKIEQHGKHRYDRTNWYGLSYEGKTLLYPNGYSKTNTSDNVSPEIKEKYHTVIEKLKKSNFYPLKESQQNELIEACETYSLSEIIDAIEQTAARSIYAWKYAYKILLTNQAQTSKINPPFRKIIRTQKLPHWFGKDEEYTPPKLSEESLAKKKRAEAIQAKYRKKESMTG